MSEYAAEEVEKVHASPLVQSTVHPDHTDDDDGAAGALVALDGAPVDGGVPTYSSGTGKHTSQVPSGSSNPFAATRSDAIAAALAANDDARFREAAISTGSGVTEEQSAYAAQFYGA